MTTDSVNHASARATAQINRLNVRTGSHRHSSGNRLQELLARIDQGVQNGSLTTEQAESLKAQLQALQTAAKSGQENGTLKPEQRMEIAKKFLAISQQIFQLTRKNIEHADSDKFRSISDSSVPNVIDDTSDSTVGTSLNVIA